MLLVNLPFVFIGANQISKEFAVKSVVAITVLAIFVHFLQLPHITNDKLLISIFGGFFLGAGIGLTIRAGAVIDGTEVLAIAVSRKTSLTVGDFITLFNATLFLLSASLIGIETAMYSMLTYLSASKTIDFVIHGVEEYLGVMVVSEKAEEIKQQIVSKLGRGVTILKSDTGYGKRGELGEEGWLKGVVPIAYICNFIVTTQVNPIPPPRLQKNNKSRKCSITFLPDTIF